MGSRSLVSIIIPTGPIIPDVKSQMRAVDNALTGTAKAIKVDYGVTTQSWRNQPLFEIITPKPWHREIFTTNEIYFFVSGGTEPHPIRAKNAPSLVFQWGGPGSYAAKTTPRIIASRAGGPTGPIVYRQEVEHPGTKAREFEKVISEKWAKRWPIILGRAVASEVYRGY